MKFVLVVFANCANDKTCRAWPSAAYLADTTAQDRKTVQANVKRLVELGYITDTGDRKGRTKQVIVYRLNYPGFGPVQEDQNRVSSKKPDFPFEEAHFSLETRPKTGYGTQRIPKEPDTPLPPTGGQPGFETFFKNFPKQVDEDKARDQWERLAPDAVLQATILAAVIDWRGSSQWQKEAGSLIPKPHNWLKNKGWLNVSGIAPLPTKAALPRQPERVPSPMPASVAAAAARILGTGARSHAVRAYAQGAFT